MTDPIASQAIWNAISSFDDGEIDVIGLQSRLEAVAATLDSSQQEVLETLRRADSDLERVIFGVRAAGQRAAAMDAIARLRELASPAPGV